MSDNESYNWLPSNIVCLAVWAVLRGKPIYELIPKDVEKAGAVKLNTLDYFPKVSSNTDLLENQAEKITNIFFEEILATGVFWEFEEEFANTPPKKSDVRHALKLIFMEGEKTLKDIAEYLDNLYKSIQEKESRGKPDE
ncbi:hypothetical protein SMW94_003857 [Vibrio parahaemolyticus]|nr:hypothetical protein [Vibrio parahaemolyticus]